MKSLTFIMFFYCCLHVIAGNGKCYWIAPSNANKVNTWICYRKDIYINNTDSVSIAKIAVDTKYWLWMNGNLVVFEGGLKRGPTPNDTYYDEIDLSKFIKEGKNQIAILVWYFGKDGFSHKSSGKAGLLFDIKSPQFSVKSDSTWLCRIHPAYENTEAPFPNFRLAESNIRFDARKDIAGWQTCLNPSILGFENAIIVASEGDAPYNKLVKRPIPQWKNFGIKFFKTTKLHRGKDQDTLVAYLPYNLQMTPYFEVNDHDGGKKISIFTDNTFAAGDVNLRAEYITKKGKQCYESLGWMNGHVVTFVFPNDITINNVGFRETGYDTNIEWDFNTNDDFIKRFWRKALRTLYVNMRDTYIDCPERERAQWWGDEVILMGESFYTCSTSVHALMKKGMYELINWQHSDGTLFSPIPAGNYDSELPGQMLASIGEYGFWNYYMNTADSLTISNVYCGVKKYLDLWTLDDTGLTNFRSGGWTWGDWGDNKDLRLIFAGWHYLALKGALKMAKVLSFDEDAAKYCTLMDKIKTGYNKCWNGTEYRHPQYKDLTDDRVQALAVLTGIADKEKYPYILDILKKQFHASPYMERYVMEALFMMDEGSFAIQRMKERYAQMVNNTSYTTLFEGWDIGPNGFGGGTVNHAWSGGPLIVIAQYICGIKPLEPGWRSFEIAPNCDILESADIKVPTIAGKIHSKFCRTDNGVIMDIIVPCGTQALVKVPGPKCKITLINGVEQLCDKGYYFRLGAGKYHIEKKY